MSSEFLLGIAQTAIGSGLGFILGLVAFRIQQRDQSEKREKDEWRAALDALNRLTTAAGANIEALAQAKLQFVNNLRPEVKLIKASSDLVFDTPVPDRAKKIQAMKSQSGSARYFFLSLPRTSVMPPPDFREYSSLSKDMPALTMFVHRAVGMMQELNERIKSRNTLIAEYAREDGVAAGVSPERFVYYLGMLADEAEAICEHTDFALDIWRLVLDQVKAYMTAKAKGEHYSEYKIVPKAVEAMPDGELFPLMREQLAVFETKGDLSP